MKNTIIQTLQTWLDNNFTPWSLSQKTLKRTLISQLNYIRCVSDFEDFLVSYTSPSNGISMKLPPMVLEKFREKLNELNERKQFKTRFLSSLNDFKKHQDCNNASQKSLTDYSKPLVDLFHEFFNERDGVLHVNVLHLEPFAHLLQIPGHVTSLFQARQEDYNHLQSQMLNMPVSQRNYAYCYGILKISEKAKQCHRVKRNYEDYQIYQHYEKIDSLLTCLLSFYNDMQKDPVALVIVNESKGIFSRGLSLFKPFMPCAGKQSDIIHQPTNF